MFKFQDTPLTHEPYFMPENSERTSVIRPQNPGYLTVKYQDQEEIRIRVIKILKLDLDPNNVNSDSISRTLFRIPCLNIIFCFFLVVKKIIYEIHKIKSQQNEMKHLFMIAVVLYCPPWAPSIHTLFPRHLPVWFVTWKQLPLPWQYSIVLSSITSMMGTTKASGFSYNVLFTIMAI